MVGDFVYIAPAFYSTSYPEYLIRVRHKSGLYHITRRIKLMGTVVLCKRIHKAEIYQHLGKRGEGRGGTVNRNKRVYHMYSSVLLQEKILVIKNLKKLNWRLLSVLCQQNITIVSM